MNKNYLPSKQFVIRLVALIAIIGIIVGIYELVHFIKNRPISKGSETTLVIKNIVQKDSNGNGIADWEESLWGLDPTKNGDSNKEFIMAKRQALSNDASANADLIPGQSTPENEALSQDFFAAIVSLQQTGNLDQVSLKAISDAVGDKITAPAIPDIYTESMAKKVATDNTSYNAYIEAYSQLIIKYKDANIGNELSFISVALRDKDAGALAIASKIATSYKSFGKDLMDIPTPDIIVNDNVSLANDYDKTGQSIVGLTQILSDPIVGMKALVNYKKYNDSLVDDINSISDKLDQ